MARPTDLRPRIAALDLPTLEAYAGLAPRADVVAAEVEGLSGRVDAAHARLTESRLHGASVDALDLTGATLADVAIADLRAADLSAANGSWRSVEVDGGRLGSFSAARATWDSVVVRGIRADYLALAAATLTDVLFVGCTFGALDLPDARLLRVAFEDCRCDEVDTRGLKASGVDLRGLDALSFTSPAGLAGVTIDDRQAAMHAREFAESLGIRVAS